MKEEQGAIKITHSALADQNKINLVSKYFGAEELRTINELPNDQAKAITMISWLEHNGLTVSWQNQGIS